MGVNVYKMVTDKIIAELKKGNIPWEKPWNIGGVAFNRVSKKPYSLLNQMLLDKEGEWASYNQWKDLGGQVRKGEQGSIVVFWKLLNVAEKDNDGDVSSRTIPLLRYFTVFHISQVDGVEPLVAQNDNVAIGSAEDVIEEYSTRENIEIRRDKASNRAFYSPKMDYISVPMLEQFKSTEEYYSTLFHEMIHSTGHASRLGRFDENVAPATFGSESYSKEELVAEIGAASLMESLGLDNSKTFKNSAAYVQSWLKALQNDEKLIVAAASKAEKAMKYIIEGAKEIEEAA